MDSEYSLTKPKHQPDGYPNTEDAALMKYFMGCLTIILVLAACETSFAPVEDDRFVVQAYLYGGEPVTDIRLTETLPIGSEDSTALPINDAEVTLIKNDVRYTLVPSPGDSGYYHYPDDDLVVETGDVFDFEATVDDVTATARTTVPLPPDEMSLSPTEMGVEGISAAEPVLVRWPNPEGNWYFITHRTIEPDPEPIFEADVILRPELLVSEPTDADSLEIPEYKIEYYGWYEAKVHRINQEYVDLYRSSEQDTRDLNEPATNIENGIGIFTAFSSREAYFEVSK